MKYSKAQTGKGKLSTSMAGIKGSVRMFMPRPNLSKIY